MDSREENVNPGTTAWGFNFRFWRFGICVCAIVATTVTLIATTWELAEAPPGIYYSDNGVNWGFVLDTAISWFVPVFLFSIAITMLLAVMRWLWQLYKQR